ncbi:MAG: trimethylamine methyltransferase family protein [Gammaproteobacteria bacterium]|nr:trimethylamine methyltransferase family protein [Gammaproteobacteria bacterium]
MARERRNRRRRGGDEVKEAAPKAPAYIKRKIPYYEVLNEESLQIIENNAETILEEIGIVFGEDPEALEIFKQAGASIEGETVHFPRGMCREIIQKTAQREFTQHARNPERSVVIGGDNMVLVPAYGPPFVHDLDNGRRYATIEDFRNFIKLAYMSDNLHHSGGTICEPVDLPVNKRHYDMVYSHIKYSDKPFMGSVTHPMRAEDSVNMAKIVFGDEFVDQNCVLVNLINANSPMTFDATMLGALKVYARNNQACIVTPFIIAGAMSPVSAAGVAAQSFAEGLAGMTLIQLLRPGAPMIYGNFVSSMSMQSGAPTFGTPEAAQVMNIGGALARRLGVPFRSGGGFTASKLPDAQAGYEAANTLNATLNAGVNFALHTAGWLEGGLAMGYEKFVMDADQAGMVRVAAEGVDMSENGQAMDALREVGPGKHFLGCDHTQKNFKTAFYRSDMADNNSYEQWVEDGSTDQSQRANAKWKKMLADYELPPLDPAIDEALIAYMEEKKASFPDSNVA